MKSTEDYWWFWSDDESLKRVTMERLLKSDYPKKEDVEKHPKFSRWTKISG